tara:strand:- start:170 stop:991 length:822 start_codon:yes stop_codon:yes gene_type:complete
MLNNLIKIYFLKAAAKKGAEQALAKKVVKAFSSNRLISFTSPERQAINNIASKINKSINVPGKPHIALRKEIYPNTYTSKAGSIYFGGNKRIPMMDVDFPAGVGKTASHMASQMPHNFKNKSDYMKFLNTFLKNPKNKNKAFRLYDTNAGLRLFDVSKRQSPLLYNLSGVPTKLRTDPLYAGKSVFDINLNRKFGPLRAKLKNRFDYRLSPKPGRKEPFIARLDDTYGYGKPIAKSVDELSLYHDDIIKAITRAHDTGTKLKLPGLLGKVDFT